MPWKNGGGETTELFIYPQGQEDFNLRLSVAKVHQNGPFSQFKDIDRWLIILSGDGVSLEFHDRVITLDQSSEPLWFKGEENIFSKLLGESVTDFNVMMRRGYGIASVQKVVGNHLSLVSQHDHFFIYQLKSESLIILEKGESFTTQDDEVIIVRINKRESSFI